MISGGDPNSIGGNAQKFPRGTIQDTGRAPGGRSGTPAGPPGDDLGHREVPWGRSGTPRGPPGDDLGHREVPGGRSGTPRGPPGDDLGHREVPRGTIWDTERSPGGRSGTPRGPPGDLREGGTRWDVTPGL
ncbi:hypothetical protein ACOMHN_052475 [Nucella lapillus]